MPADGIVEGVFPDMKVTSLLIIWSLPLLQAGVHDHSLSCGRDDIPHAEACVSSSAMPDAGHLFLHDDSSWVSPGVSLGDEEDSSEDDVLHGGLLLCGPWRLLEAADLSSSTHSRHELVRLPTPSHPLRC